MSYSTIDVSLQIDSTNVASNSPHEKYADITTVSEEDYETRCQYQLDIETLKKTGIVSGFDTNTVVTAFTLNMLWELLFPNELIGSIDEGRVKALWSAGGKLSTISKKVDNFAFSTIKNILLVRVHVHGINLKKKHVGTYFTLRVQYNAAITVDTLVPSKQQTLIPYLQSVATITTNLNEKQLVLLDHVRALYKIFDDNRSSYVLIPEEQAQYATSMDKYMDSTIYTGRLATDVLINLFNVQTQLSTFLTETRNTFRVSTAADISNYLYTFVEEYPTIEGGYVSITSICSN